ncbi:Uncharacterised protein [uncultured archaeon]|nr:Uncharacterised protein [uncultured archaeon]
MVKDYKLPSINEFHDRRVLTRYKQDLNKSGLITEEAHAFYGSAAFLEVYYTHCKSTNKIHKIDELPRIEEDFKKNAEVILKTFQDKGKILQFNHAKEIIKRVEDTKRLFDSLNK